jgi:PAS domain S-box-containing protein
MRVTASPTYEAAIDQAMLAAIVESSDDAIVSTDLGGIVRTWNGAAQQLYGYAPSEIIGKPVTILIPPDRQHEEAALLARVRRGERIEHYETVRCRKDGTPLEISLSVSPIRNAEGGIVGASKIARDITRRRRDEALLRHQAKRLETLNRIAKLLSSDLDLERIVQTVTDTATELAGAKFGAFFYNVTHRGRESYLLYTLSGAPREAFERFGLPRATAVFAPTFHGTRVVRSQDIRADPRYGKNAPHHGMPKGHLPVVSYLAVPVISRTGEVIGGLFFGHDEPAVFTDEAEEIVTGIAAHAAIAIDNARLFAAAQEEAQGRELLLSEFKHRIKNTLATVQAIVSQTLPHAPAAERQALRARLDALAKAHDLLTEQSWDHAAVRELVRRALAPFPGDAFEIDGPEAQLNATQSLLLTMTLHELGTNAMKYGALSDPRGKIQVTWAVVDNGLAFRWQETGGPPVGAPQRKGFGSLLIEKATDGKGHLEFRADGVVCTIDMPVEPPGTPPSRE